MALELKNLYDDFRDAATIKAYAKIISEDAAKLDRAINIMEVCGGHTHTIMKYGILQLLPQNIKFVHGPGCPVCVMPKERIDHAYALAMQEDVILVTLGDMIKVPGSKGSLQDARSRGADVRFVYSPLDTLKIACENPTKKIIFFAIGFETTTPMSAALLDAVIKQKIPNILFHINHVTVPEAMELLLSDAECKIDAFLGPSHVSVISGSKIYEPFPVKWGKPVVVSGFEPVDVMESISMIVKQFLEKRCELEVQYKRAVKREGNLNAQKLVDKYFQKAAHFRFRGLGDIPGGGLELREEFDAYNAEKIHADILPHEPINDHKLCICGEILKGKATPPQCSIFGTACKPSSPVGSCMVSSEGACAAYYKYGNLV
ncbi:MAG: hydrogenase formation protein HypD [Epsilonproteobacteria bacterium]|nr:hydrogenase formation protein HypD [Campylobacterota bacterium]